MDVFKMEEPILSLVSNFGFAAVVAFYLLTQTTNAIKNNTQALNDLKAALMKRHHIDENDI